eukprot:SAG22_NODE_2542_length_2462_cov_4.573424_1_plen_95_part_10
MAQPGALNDPDELYVGSGSLTPDEEETVFAMWAIMTGPLLVGIDFRKVPPASAAILLNAEVSNCCKTLPFCCVSTVFLSKTMPFLAVCLSLTEKV